MAIKRDDNFEDDEEDSDTNQILTFPTILVGVILIILSEAFFYLLSSKTGSPFGLTQMVFALMLAIVITLFLLWIRWIMFSDKYMGLFISLVGTVAMYYALTRKYQGTYTTIFAIIGAILILGYTVIQFVQANKK
ncbi:hypothetical protein J4423_00745 [Candidatus Pacearchaeota archaeon]|nr:hypothetical protein [Candidatus Pacearchaeota archaeon]